MYTFIISSCRAEESRISEHILACYLLFVALREARHIQVGKLGRFYFPAGRYIYVGRAKKNIDARLRRHARKEKTLRWHIDYILAHGEVIETKTFPGDDECGLAKSMIVRGEFRVPVRKFGSSDCSCISHFFYWNGSGCSLETQIFSQEEDQFSGICIEHTENDI